MESSYVPSTYIVPNVITWVFFSQIRCKCLHLKKWSNQDSWEWANSSFLCIPHKVKIRVRHQATSVHILLAGVSLHLTGLHWQFFSRKMSWGPIPYHMLFMHSARAPSLCLLCSHNPVGTHYGVAILEQGFLQALGAWQEHSWSARLLNAYWASCSILNVHKCHRWQNGTLILCMLTSQQLSAQEKKTVKISGVALSSLTMQWRCPKDLFASKVKVDQLAQMGSAGRSQEISSKYMAWEFGWNPSPKCLHQSHLKKAGKEWDCN